MRLSGPPVFVTRLAAESWRILFVTSECTPFAQTGGLGDVSSALPIALRARGLEPSVVMPLYRSVDRSTLEPTHKTFVVPVGAARVMGRVWRTTLRGGVPVFLVEQDGYFDRDGVYGPDNEAYPDNLERFVFLSRASLEVARLFDLRPHVVHANDWPTALLPVLLQHDASSPLAGTPSVLTIHNVGYQGVFPLSSAQVTGLGAEQFHPGSLEHYGRINLLKGGVYAATKLTTVSARYAQEIQQGAFGCGLDGVIRSRGADLTGILNGIDTETWNPRTDALLPARYDLDDPSGKLVCKADVQRAAGLPVRPDVPLFGMVTRLNWQKGVDVLAQALRRVLDLEAQVVLLGTGDHEAEAFFRAASEQRRDKFHAWIGFDQGLAHRIEAGADFFVMPSRYEPCGLNQMYSLRYGTLPLVRATGGLDDTVDNYDEATGAGTGFKLHDLNAGSLYDLIGWAVSTWYDRPLHLRAMRARAMRRDFSWDQAALRYEEVYAQAMGRTGTEDDPLGDDDELRALRTGT